LRDVYIAATTPAEKKAAAEAVQKHQTQAVTHVHLGEWIGVSEVRSNITTPAVPSPVTAFWAVTKK